MSIDGHSQTIRVETPCGNPRCALIAAELAAAKATILKMQENEKKLIGDFDCEHAIAVELERKMKGRKS